MTVVKKRMRKYFTDQHGKLIRWMIIEETIEEGLYPEIKINLTKLHKTQLPPMNYPSEDSDFE
jgi:hypothetical protein